MTLEQLLAQWRSDATTIRDYGGKDSADAVERCADQLEETMRDEKDESLSLAEASAECGYSVSHLRRLARDGQLVNVGKKGAPRVRRGDLPRKPSAQQPQTEEVILQVLREY